MNIYKTPTLPSLAFKIFRTHYLKPFQIPKLTGQIYQDLMKAYYGGHVDMYIPKNINDEKVFWYDVNSLYPKSMKDHLYPINDIQYFVGDPIHSNYNMNDSKKLGVFKVKINAPEDI